MLPPLPLLSTFSPASVRWASWFQRRVLRSTAQRDIVYSLLIYEVDANLVSRPDRENVQGKRFER